MGEKFIHSPLVIYCKSVKFTFSPELAVPDYMIIHLKSFWASRINSSRNLKNIHQNFPRTTHLIKVILPYVQTFFFKLKVNICYPFLIALDLRGFLVRLGEFRDSMFMLE